jgi:membrane-bound lytic murein transglycosylase D
MLVCVQVLVLGTRQASLQPPEHIPPEPQSQQRSAAPPPPGAASPVIEWQPDFATLLHETLLRFRIDPTAVPAFFREQVRKRLRDYALLYPQELRAMLHRASPYLPMIKVLLKQHSVPSYFAFLPLVESAFQVHAEHPQTGARGLWQLLPETARAYGLRVSQQLDERLDPFRSTRAAARYLRELQDMFGQDAPLLVLAAYNFGENNLARAIVQARTRDIWSLFHKRQIPYQTRDYLVKMVALWVLISHAERFQLTLATPEYPRSFAEITFPDPVTLTTVAQQMALPVEQLQAMNPHVLRIHIPAHLPIRVPRKSVEAHPPPDVQVTASIAPEQCCTPLTVAQTCWHTVEAGESVSTIAQRYAVDVATLKLLNQLEGANPIIRPGQRLATCEPALTRSPVGHDLW